MEELQQAYRQSMEERRRHLVVVVLEDVAQSDMAPVLRRCCKTFTYLHVKDALFWDRSVCVRACVCVCMCVWEGI